VRETLNPSSAQLRRPLRCQVCFRRTESVLQARVGYAGLDPGPLALGSELDRNPINQLRGPVRFQAETSTGRGAVAAPSLAKLEPPPRPIVSLAPGRNPTMTWLPVPGCVRGVRTVERVPLSIGSSSLSPNVRQKPNNSQSYTAKVVNIPSQTIRGLLIHNRVVVQFGFEVIFSETSSGMSKTIQICWPNQSTPLL
jgi:hypothetical protein